MTKFFPFFITQGFLSAFFTLFNRFEGHFLKRWLTETWQEMFGVGGTAPLWNFCSSLPLFSLPNLFAALTHPLVSAEHRLTSMTSRLTALLKLGQQYYWWNIFHIRSDLRKVKGKYIWLIVSLSPTKSHNQRIFQSFQELQVSDSSKSLIYLWTWSSARELSAFQPNC